VSHDAAYQRLPDLLFDHGEPSLVAHLEGCDVCRKQLSLLVRIDRLLRARIPRAPSRLPAGRLRIVASSHPETHR
jgi:hypothetical protein